MATALVAAAVCVEAPDAAEAAGSTAVAAAAAAGLAGALSAAAEGAAPCRDDFSAEEWALPPARAGEAEDASCCLVFVRESWTFSRVQKEEKQEFDDFKRTHDGPGTCSETLFSSTILCIG